MFFTPKSSGEIKNANPRFLSRKPLLAGKGFAKPAPDSQPPTPSPAVASTSSVADSTTTSSESPPTNDERSDSDRQDAILREKFGLTPLAERKSKPAPDPKAVKKDVPNDVFAMIPAPIMIGIDRFLKGGVAVSTLAFVLAGIAITIEAWSAASKQPLPPALDEFIVQTIEPNFTPGLGVLLGFSVSLGVFTAAQLGSESANYKE
ncbi:hypothetical protein TrLO_g13601 [Triparma laevis f. longispina]|uniref:Uncharacterized protein n=1 Tax=Triparma laevis f. longispina TaxID=1714387 RepID=A0A9W7EHK7_9STRA|nr:hypothetical protein TrLO_g13601 [Triparma laevis f. longispina]